MMLLPEAQASGDRSTPATAGDWPAWLSNASRVLSSTLDYEATLSGVAQLVVPTFADWCFVDLLQPDGQIRRVSVAHADPAQAELAASVRREFVLRADAAAGVGRVVATGEPELVEVEDTVLEGIALDEEHLDSLRQMRVRAHMCVPLRARGRILGAMVFAATDSGRRYTGEDLRRAADLADRAALAIDNARLHEAEQQARRRAERLQELTAALTIALTPAEVGAVVMGQGVVAMRAFAGVVALRTGDGAELEILSSIGYNQCMGPGVRWPVAASIPIAEAARTGEAVFVESPEAWEARYGAYTPGSASSAWAAIPLLAHRDKEPSGALLWTFDHPQTFGSDDRPLFVAVGRLCAQALERARLHEAEQRAREAAERGATRLRRLQAATARLSEALTASEVAAVVMEHGLAALGARAGSVALLVDEELELLSAVGYPPEAIQRFRRIPLDSPFPLSDAVREREPIILSTAEERAARYPHLADLRRHNGSGPMAALPLTVEGRIIGTLGLNFPEDVKLAADDRAFLLALADQCAQALERARLYEAERRARAEAEEANRAKSQFLASMSHELRTPLNAIGGYAQLLSLGLRGPVSREQQADLQRIETNQRHLLTLINDILDFAKIEAGRVEIAARSLVVEEVLAELEALVAPQLQEKALQYTVSVDDPGLEVHADPEKLRQILLNLLSNAIKFTAAGGQVSIRAACVDGSGHISVADTGVGIPAAKLDTVFEPFVQLDRSLTSDHHGTGLGLAISRDLARAMRGELDVYSEPGAGSTFTLSLPCREEEQPG